MDLPQDAGIWTSLFPILILALVIFRNARTRKVRLERLWIGPVIILGVVALVFSQQAVPGPLAIAFDVAALALGALLGWWRGRASRFTVDPETHEVTSRASMAGMALILAIFAARFAVRRFFAGEASPLHVSAIEATDAFLLMAVGLVCAHRLEWWIRARRMVAETKAAA